MVWKKVIIVSFLGLLVGCGKNDGIRTAGGGFYPTPNPYGPSNGPVLPPSAPNYPYPPYGGGYPYGGGGYFQPSFPMGYGNQFYPWMPIYVFYQQTVVLQPVFINIWTGWQNYAYLNRLPVYDFTSFWYQYCPQVMSPQLYLYFSDSFYPWMTPTTYFSPQYTPQVFWQNYSGTPFTYTCGAGCY